jgi:hypothetical protein
MLNQIIHNNNPAPYRMKLIVLQGDLVKEDTRVKKDAAYAREVTLESVMDDFRNVYESLHLNKKAQPKGSILLIATPPPKGKKFP